ncbi:hypothetical protein Mtc_1376 [Methanocella conradii HZ254]|uniref:Uncharacterized protein n=1 Tax=Methanocella conradii (strain DSM 24694 / JCM 17849 / CGMCC 1.5162 / HZ254) TaxID=1041930 RepID=H8IAN3_METCZ|nr:hypothetical protein Mtc_1376 [Methanocella conradii HZ254]
MVGRLGLGRLVAALVGRLGRLGLGRLVAALVGRLVVVDHTMPGYARL